ncbi:MAG: hypothetical protein Q9181_008105 [Wetmoreana brouardii]
MPDGNATTFGTFDYYNAQARKKQQTLRSFGIYGAGSLLYYAAVWHNDPTLAKWHVRPNLGRITDLGFAIARDEEQSLPNFRPYSIPLSLDRQYASAWIDNDIGEYSAHYANLTGANYQDVFDRLSAQGQYPVNLQAGGVGAETRYTAIFAYDDIPSTRTFTQESSNSFVSGIAAADSAMREFMTSNAVRSAQLTVYQKGVAKHQGAYEYTEPRHSNTTSVGSQYLLAGLSEIFVAAAVQYCYDHDLFAPTTTVFPFLGFQNPVNPPQSVVPKDTRSNSITIQNLLDHEAGYAYTSTGDPDTSTDPTYHMLAVAASLGLTAANGRTLTARDLAAYMYTKVTLNSDPGTVYHDSSIGYVLLTLCIERAAGVDFVTFLNNNITASAGLTIRQYPTDRPDSRHVWSPLLVQPNDDRLGNNPYSYFILAQYPYVYGGDGMIKEIAVGSAGLAGSATDLVEFIQTHAVQGHGPRAAGRSRVSSNPGGTAYAESRDDGVDWALVMNTLQFANSTEGDALGGLVDAINGAIDDGV